MLILAIIISVVTSIIGGTSKLKYVKGKRDLVEKTIVDYNVQDYEWQQFDHGDIILNDREYGQVFLLITPKIPNKDLIAHCHSKAIELREDDSMKELLDVEFDVLAHDENFYVTEILRAKNILNQKVKFDVEIPSEEEIIDWRQCQSESIITLSNKIEKLFPDSDKEKKQKQVNKYVS